MSATHKSINDLISLDSQITHIIIDNGVKTNGVIGFDFSCFSQLQLLEIGSGSFCGMYTVRITGLQDLESVIVGANSFNDENGRDVCRDFCLKNCPKLKSLIVYEKSFAMYSVCEIENVDALEVIEMVGLREESNSFRYASLELKSIRIHSE